MKNIFYRLGIFALILSIGGCAMTSPKNIKLMAGKPMDSTSIDSYPSIKTLYQSDKELYIVTHWDNCIRSKGHELKWELINDDGFSIYNTVSENVTLKPHSFHTERIFIGNNDKDSLLPGNYTLKLYIDSVLSKKISGQYIPKSIINKNIKNAVILPFNDVSVATNIKYNLSSYIISTFSSAFYNEVKRIIPWTTPHYVSEETAGDLSGPDCFEDKTCVKKLTHVFDEDIIISGNIRLSKYVVETDTLTVYVYHSKTGEIKKFSYSQNPRGDLTYSKVMHDLIYGVMHEKGFLDYLISFNTMS